MHNFLVHSNERACRKSGRLGLNQVIYSGIKLNSNGKKSNKTSLKRLSGL